VNLAPLPSRCSRNLASTSMAIPAYVLPPRHASRYSHQVLGSDCTRLSCWTNRAICNPRIEGVRSTCVPRTRYDSDAACYGVGDGGGASAGGVVSEPGAAGAVESSVGAGIGLGSVVAGGIVVVSAGGVASSASLLPQPVNRTAAAHKANRTRMGNLLQVSQVNDNCCRVRSPCVAALQREEDARRVARFSRCCATKRQTPSCSRSGYER